MVETHPIPPSSSACTHHTAGQRHHWNTHCGDDELWHWAALWLSEAVTIVQRYTPTQDEVHEFSLYSLQYSYVTVCSLGCVSAPVFLETHQQNVWLDTTQTCPLVDRQQREKKKKKRSQDCFTQQLQLLLAVFFKRRDGKIWLHCLLQCEQTKLWNKYLKYFAPITLNSLQKHFKLFCLILKLLKVQWWMNGLALVYVSRYFKLFYILVYICYDFESSAAVLMLLSLFKKRPFFSKEMIWFKWVKRKYNWQSRIKNVNRIMSSYVHGRMHWCSNQIRSIFDKYLLYWEVFQYFTC